MKSIKLLDCTLRDGAYVNDARFGYDSIKYIVKNLVKAHIDIVECGWLKNDESSIDSTYFQLPSDLKKYDICKENSMISLMIDYNRYDMDNIKGSASDIDYLRITFPINKFSEGLLVGGKAKDKGIKISFQLTNAKSYLNNDLFRDKENFFKKLNELMPDGVCLADTFGSMVPDDVERLSKIFDLSLDKKISLGLHTHNNMQLAFANTIKFIDVAKAFDRDIIVDSSLLGMGRGVGNTPTELLSDYLNKYCNKDYDVDILLDIIDKHMSKYMDEYSWSYSPYLAVAGMQGSHINNVSYLKEKYDISVNALKKVLDNYGADLKAKYDYDLLDEAYKRIIK